MRGQVLLVRVWMLLVCYMRRTLEPELLHIHLGLRMRQGLDSVVGCKK